PALLALAVWKQRGLGELPVLSAPELRVAASAAVAALPVAGIGEMVKLDWEHLQENFDGLREFFWSVRVLEVVPIAGAVAVARFSFAKAAFFGAWLAAFLVFKGSSDEASMASGSFFRLLMPAFPAYFLLAVSIPLLVPTVGPRIAAAYRVGRDRLRWRSPRFAAAAVLLGLVPLAIVSALPVLEKPLTASDFSKDLFLPINRSFDVTGSATAAGVELQWPETPAGATSVQYQVWRSPPVKPAADAVPPPVLEGIRCRTVSGGAQDCAIEMDVLGATGTRSWRDLPPPGRWTYRVGVLAGWRGVPESADLVVISDPVTVTVP
ncbi:MAG: hypothetical protein ACRDN6_07500, partial [Gaiellaceae bacterium]